MLLILSFILIFKKNFVLCEKLKTSLKQINNKRTLVNLRYCVGHPCTHFLL